MSSFEYQAILASFHAQYEAIIQSGGDAKALAELDEKRNEAESRLPIQINGNSIDTYNRSPHILWPKDATKTNYIILRFNTKPLPKDWKEQLLAAVVEILLGQYYHPVCRYMGTDLQKLEKFEFVAQALVYLDEFKIASNLKEKMRRMVDNDDVRCNIILHTGETKTGKELAEELEPLLYQSSLVHHKGLVEVNLTKEEIIKAARIDGVDSIEEFHERRIWI